MLVLMLASFTAGVEYVRGDVDLDGKVTVADVTSLIDYLLKGTWDDGPQVDNHEWVNLGLPSGTLWATCNVGADNPEDYGDYFAWGETEPKSIYTFSTYKWCNGSYNTLTKYCTNSDLGTVDNKTELDPEDDVAYVNWGPLWCMPSVDQINELLENCSREWTMLNDVSGWLITGPNGNSMFLPSAGYRWDDYVADTGGICYYWTRTLFGDPTCAHVHYLTYDTWTWMILTRDYGLPVRAVRAPQN